MKYCENCGAQLENTSMFCEECGTKQESLPTIEKAPSNKSKHTLIIVLIILFLLGIGCGLCYYFFVYENPNTTEHVSETVEDETVEDSSESETLYDSVEWSHDMNLINSLKETTLIGYERITIHDAFANYNTTTWSSGNVENVTYLLVEYIDNDNSHQIIINTTLAQVDEFFLDGVAQEEDVKTALIDKLFDIKLPFLGKSGSYTSVGSSLNITIDGDIVTSNIFVDFYEEELIGKIISDTEAEVRMPTGEVIRYTWLDENRVSVSPVDGFSQETLSMVRLICQALTNVVYTFESDELSKHANFVATYLPDVGFYINSNEGGLPNTYEIAIHSTTNTSFTFSVVEIFDSTGETVNRTIIDHGVAEFSEAEIVYADYVGEDIQLSFDCSYASANELIIIGYEPMTRLGTTFTNFAAEY